jgi:hypothetical protein
VIFNKRPLTSKENVRFKQYLKLLKKTPRSWIVKKGCIRLKIGKKEFTSLEAALLVRKGVAPLEENILNESKVLGLSDFLGQNIIRAEDRIRGYMRELREQILEAVGIVENEKK